MATVVALPAPRPVSTSLKHPILFGSNTVDMSTPQSLKSKYRKRPLKQWAVCMIEWMTPLGTTATA
jgi:hypothetical protein